MLLLSNDRVERTTLGRQTHIYICVYVCCITLTLHSSFGFVRIGTAGCRYGTRVLFGFFVSSPPSPPYWPPFVVSGEHACTFRFSELPRHGDNVANTPILDY